MQQQRKKKSPEAVLNQRGNRHRANLIKRGDVVGPARLSAAENRDEQARCDREIAARLTRKHYLGRSTEAIPLLDDLRYWQARRCGWDMQKLMPNGICFWNWWCRLDRAERREYVRMAREEEMSVVDDANRAIRRMTREANKRQKMVRRNAAMSLA